METRYTGESTLDEPVSVTIVSCRSAASDAWFIRFENHQS